MLRPDSIVSPAPARTFTTELAPVMSPSRGVGYDYAGFSQFLRPVFHWQDSRPYGLRAEDTEVREKIKITVSGAEDAKGNDKMIGAE